MVKSLHLAENIEALNKMAELNADIKIKPAKQLCKSTKTVLKKAEEQNLLGDQENAYIFYMKYFNLISVIQNRKDFAKIKSEAREHFGTNDQINERLDTLARLKESLKERYAERDSKALKMQQEIEANKENIPAKNAYTTTTGPNSGLFISCTQLYKQISSDALTTLLIDCRSENDFQDSRIHHNGQINVPEDVIENGNTASMLTNKIPHDSLELWGKRDRMDSIILVDEETSELQPPDKSKPIWIMRNILIEWDPDREYKNLLLLEGGFQNFVLTYPMKTTNPRYMPKSKEVPSLYPNLQDIEYPDFGDIKMKPKPSEPTPYIPRIDRTNKPNSGPKFMNTQQPINPVALAREKEIMYDQILEKEKEVLTIGTELNRMMSSTNSPNESDQTEWFSKHTELEYKLYQKENELNDTVSELHSVSQQELDEGMNLKTLQINQNPDFAAIKARIEAKERAHSQFEMKHKEIKQNIEAKSSTVKEQQKRHLEAKDEEDELIRPKMPTIDRSSKPTNDQPAQFLQIQRDFSPVHGSYGEKGATGLKNLGNTCYMNSIIQCLLNFENFCEYLTKDLYLKHINRKSKTGGLVAEELAQLCKELWSGKYKSIAPRDFRAVIGREHKIFATYDQQDSHEFLVLLIDLLNSELQFPMDMKINENTHKSDVAWREFMKNMQSVIQQVFFGQIRSTVKCRTCGFESATYDGFSHLSLELPQNNKQCELYDCFDLYFNGEIIDGWTCPHCKQSREAVKKLDISKMPMVLVIHLKRFYASMTTSNTYEKKQNYVHFPINNFNITDYITPSLKHGKARKQYELYAVSNHYGTMNRGHYTAFCKNANSEKWYKYDDNYVTRIDENDVNSSAGYILFYSSL